MGVDIDAVAEQHEIFAMPDKTSQPVLTVAKVLIANPDNELYNDYMEYIIDKEMNWFANGVFSNGYRQFDAINLALAQGVGGDIVIDEKEENMPLSELNKQIKRAHFVLPEGQRKRYNISQRTIDNFTAYLNTEEYIIPDMIDAILNLTKAMPAAFYDQLDEETKFVFGQYMNGLTMYQDYVLSISY